MRHCSSCEHCYMRLRPLYLLGLVMYRCNIDYHDISHPFFKGWLCKDYRKDGGG